MGWLQTMGKRIALRVSSIVARNELFERYGERPVQPPLKPGTWVAPTSEEEAGDDDPEPACRLISNEGLQNLIRQGPVVIHHWATWCEACVEEAPSIKALEQQVAIPVVGLSWDAFEGQPASSCKADVAAVAEELEWAMPQYVLNEKPEDFFEIFEMEFRQVPQTWLVDGNAQRVLNIDGEIDDEALSALLKTVAGLQ